MKFRVVHVSLSDVARFHRRQTLIFLMALAMVAAVRTPAWSQHAPDIIWLESNSTEGNSILAFKHDAAGTTTFIGSTPTGGIGVFDETLALGPFDCDQNLIVNPEGTLLCAVNSGSNSVSVFHITPDGLQSVTGSAFLSSGSNPVRLGLKGGVLVVVNKDQDPAQNGNLTLPNRTTFRVWPSGQLNPIAHSTVPLAYSTFPSRALIASQGSFVFGAAFLGGLLQSFGIQAMWPGHAGDRVTGSNSRAAGNQNYGTPG